MVANCGSVTDRFGWWPLGVPIGRPSKGRGAGRRKPKKRGNGKNETARTRQQRLRSCFGVRDGPDRNAAHAGLRRGLGVCGVWGVWFVGLLNGCVLVWVD